MPRSTAECSRRPPAHGRAWRWVRYAAAVQNVQPLSGIYQMFYEQSHVPDLLAQAIDSTAPEAAAAS